jgi:hypothetical protein
MADKSAYQMESSDQQGKSAEKKLQRQVIEDKGDPFAAIKREFDLRYDAVRAYRQNSYEQLWDMVDEEYYGRANQLDEEDKEKDYRSNIRSREGYVQVESITSKVVPSLLNNEPPISIDPFDYTDPMLEQAHAVEQDLQYTFMHRMNPVDKVTRWIKSGGRYGIGVMKLLWLFDYGWQSYRNPIYNEDGSLTGYTKLRREGVRQDRPDVRNVQTRNFWWNMDADSPDTLRWTIERYFRPKSMLMQLQKQGIYRNVDKLTPVVRPPRMEQEPEEIRTDADKFQFTGEDMIEVFEYWTKDYMAVIGNDEEVLLFRDNPFDDNIIPYYFYRATVSDSDFVGVGEVEPILELAEGADIARNQRIDNVNRIVHRPLVVGATAGIKGKVMRFKPGKIIRAIDPSQVTPLIMPDVTASSYKEVQEYERLIDKTNGNPEFTRGEQPGKRATATEIATRTNSANLRVDLKVQFAQIELARLYRDMFRLEQQFGDRNRTVTVLGQKGLYVSRRHGELYQDEYRFRVRVGGYLGNKLIDRQQFMQMFQTVLTSPERQASQEAPGYSGRY